MTVGIYTIKNKINGKVYIGSSTNIERRWVQHLSALKNNRHHSAHLQRSWNSNNQLDFEFSILQITNLENLIAVEQINIALFKAIDPDYGYNMSPTAGSCLGFRHGDEFKKKCSERNIRRYKNIDQRVKTGQKSKESWTEAHKESASIRMKNKWADVENRKILSELTSQGASRPDVVEKRSKRMKEKFSSQRERDKAMLASPHRKRVKHIETGDIYESIAEAAKKLSVSTVKIRDSASGKRKSNGGMSFEWVNNV